MAKKQVIIEYTGEQRDLLQKIQQQQKANKKNEEQIAKLTQTAKRGGKAMAGGYDQAQKSASQYEKQIRNLEFAINRNGKATLEEGTRLKRLNKALELTKNHMASVEKKTETVTEKTKKSSTAYERAQARVSKYDKEIKNLEYTIRKQGKATDFQAIRLGRLSRALNTTKQNMEGAGNSTDNASGKFAAGAGSALKLVAGLTGIGSAAGIAFAIVGQLKRELAHLREQQKMAADKQKTIAEVKAEAYYNLPEGFAKEDLNKVVENASKDFKVKQEDIWRAVGGPLSAMGNLTKEQFTTAFRQGVRAFALSGADISSVTGGAMDVTRITGGSAEQSLGWMRQVGQQMRVTTRDEQIATVVPVIAAAKQFGWSPESGGELASYFTQFSSDITGKKSSTGAINFMQKIMGATTKSGALIPEYGQDGPFGKKKLKFRPIKEAGEAGLGELQNWYATASKELRREFSAKMPGEAKVKGAILALIARDPKALAAYDQAKKAISSPTAAGVGSYWGNWFKQGEGEKEFKVRKVDQIFDKAIEDNLMNNPEALAGVVREKLGEWVKTLPGSSDMAVKYAAADFELETGFGRHDVLKAAHDRVKAMQEKFGFGQKYKVDSDILWGIDKTSYADKLPEDAKQRSSGSVLFGNTKKIDEWETHPEFRTINTYTPNPNYNPQQGESINELIGSINGLIVKLDQMQGQTQPVKIVGDSRPLRPNPNAHDEGGL